MPHCTVEYSANIPLFVDAREFFSGLHKVLASFDTIQAAKIKSRLVRQEDCFVGDGDPRNAFVFLHLAMFEGRDPSTLKDVGTSALSYLKNYFGPCLGQLRCSITVEIREIERATFFSVSDRTEPLLKAI